MKIFLDDVRQPGVCLHHMYYTMGDDAAIYNDEDWQIVRNYDEFTKLVKDNIGKIDLISFDHDLAPEHYHPSMMDESADEYNKLYHSFKHKTGYDAALWLIDVYNENKLELPEVIVHSMNPVGRKNIENLMAHI